MITNITRTNTMYSVDNEYQYEENNWRKAMIPILGVSPEFHKEIHKKGYLLYISQGNWINKIVLGNYKTQKFYGFFPRDTDNTEAVIDTIVSIEAGLL